VVEGETSPLNSSLPIDILSVWEYGVPSEKTIPDPGVVINRVE
jgi:hypothetical protein